MYFVRDGGVGVANGARVDYILCIFGIGDAIISSEEMLVDIKTEFLWIWEESTLKLLIVMR